ncbi:MAG: SPFH domain-containing protein [Bradymonadia bacterium]
MKILNWISGIIIILWLAPSACLERIEPGKIGVRRSLSGGVSEADFRVGYHLSLPFWHSWYQLDGTLHYLEFNQASPAGSLELRTKENNIIFIDLTIPFRIKKDEGWQIVKEGFSTSYKSKMKSQAVGVLRKELAELSSLDVQVPEKRQTVAEKALPLLNEALSQYHIEATHVIIRGIRFRQQYEQKLQNKQLYIVQGRLDEALGKESKARQETETLKKVIDKDLALKAEEWNRKIEEEKSTYELQIAQIQAQTKKYVRAKRAQADAMFSELEAEGNLAEAKAAALGEKLKAEALASKAGRTFSAIEAAKRFQLGDIQLNSSDPRFLYEFGSMAAWRRFFLGE